MGWTWGGLEAEAGLEVEGLAHRAGGGGVAGADGLLAGAGGEGVFEAEVEPTADVAAHHGGKPQAPALEGGDAEGVLQVALAEGDAGIVAVDVVPGGLERSLPAAVGVAGLLREQPSALASGLPGVEPREDGARGEAPRAEGEAQLALQLAAEGLLGEVEGAVDAGDVALLQAVEVAQRHLGATADTAAELHPQPRARRGGIAAIAQCGVALEVGAEQGRDAEGQLELRVETETLLVARLREGVGGSVGVVVAGVVVAEGEADAVAAAHREACTADAGQVAFGVGGHFAEEQGAPGLPQGVEAEGGGAVAAEVVLVVGVVAQLHRIVEEHGGGSESKDEVAAAEGKVAAAQPLAVGARTESRQAQAAGQAQGGRHALLPAFLAEPTLKSKACLKCLYFTIIIFDLCRYLEYFSYLCTINQTE